MVAPVAAIGGAALRIAVQRLAKKGLKKGLKKKTKARSPKKRRRKKQEGKDFDEALKEALEEMAFRMEAEAVRMCPVNTGALMGSITSGVEEDTNTVWVGAGFDAEVDYAKYVEYGTPPHIISPKDKKALYWKGAEHPVKRVKHPGTRPKPFLRPAANKVKREFPAILAKKLSG